MLYLGPSALPKPNAKAINTAPDISDWQRYYQLQAQSCNQPLLRQFYHAGMVANDTPICDVPLLALDIETTGLDPASCGIVSIGLMPMNSQRVYSSQAKQWLLKPRVELSDSSITLHRITHSDIAQAPDLTAVLPDLLRCLAGKVIVLHYRGIERPFLHAAIKARLGLGLYFPVIDTMALEARLHRKKPRTLWQALSRQNPLSIRLADSRLRYGLPPYRPHHAVTDALACAELLQAQLARHFNQQTAVGKLWC
jgi:DNA polymerase III subunit epsilon